MRWDLSIQYEPCLGTLCFLGVEWGGVVVCSSGSVWSQSQHPIWRQKLRLSFQEPDPNWVVSDLDLSKNDPTTTRTCSMDPLNSVQAMLLTEEAATKELAPKARAY